MIIKPTLRNTIILALLLVAGVSLAGIACANPPAHASLTATVPAPAGSTPTRTPPAADLAQARDLADGLSLAFEQATNVVSPSVVAVFAEAPAPEMPSMSPGDPFRQFFGDDFFRRFFPQEPPTAPQGPGRGHPTLRSMGSGVIVSADGLVLTNNHVVDHAEKITVVLGDDRKVPARVVGTDPPTDVAVLRLEGENLGELPVVRLGDSDGLRVGQWVIAVGNPFQLLHTVTAGIVSARGRSAMGLADYEDFIQTDASINPGNSGGALADLDGRLVGINTAISTTNGGSVGIGFAIPINMAKRVMEELVAHGEVSRGYLALLPQDVDDNLASALHLGTTVGALVGDVTAGGPAAKAGLERGDVITRFDGQPVEDALSLRNQVAEARPGSRVPITVLRNGREKTLSVELGERPREEDERSPAVGGPAEPGNSEKLGMGTQALTPELAHRLGIDEPRGVIITDVAPGGAAEQAGLSRGDVIVEVDRQAVATPAELDRALAHHEGGDSAALLVRRGPNTLYVGVRVS